MRVLHVVEVGSGGVVTYLRALVSGQVAAGHDVHVLAPAGVTVPGATTHTWDPARRTPWRFPGAVTRLRRVRGELRPDVVHLHSFFPGLLGRVARDDRAHGGALLVYQPHSWAFEAAPGRSHLVVSAWERRAAARTDLLLVNCEDELREGVRRGVTTPGACVGIPLDLDTFRPADQREQDAARRSRGIDPDTFLVVCVGRISRQKGQDLLVSAWESRRPAAGMLALVGQGDVTGLAALAPRTWDRSIIAAGATTDVRGWLIAADVVVMPSRYEGQSVAMAEAMACGVPVVSTEVNGAAEALLQGPEPPAGVVVGSEDAAALLAECAALQSSPQRRRAAAVAGRQRAERQFSGRAVTERVLGAYSRSLDRTEHGERSSS